MSQPDTPSTPPASTAQPGFEVLDAAHLDARLNAVRDALRMCPTEVPASLSIPAHKALDAVAQRLALGVDHTVIALFGGTGSGKSSLFNALTQLNFADVGARRPTTSRAAARPRGAGARPPPGLPWGVPRPPVRRDSILDAEDQGSMSGLVLLDVPDYDSVTTEHSLQVDRLVPLADILVWVVDPQKYADAALHDGYLRGLGARQEDMLVLVNQVDTLPESGLASLLDDVGSLLKEDGLSRVQVLPVSAVRGDNLDVVRDLLRQRVARESNAARTASAELDAITRRLRPTVAKGKVELNADLTEDTTKVLLQASGAQAVEDSVRASLSKVLPRALARPEPPSRTAVASAHSTWVHRTSQGLPPAWARSMESSVVPPETLTGQTAEAVGSVPLPGHRQPAIDLLWWGGLLLVLGGLSWLVVSVVRTGVQALLNSVEIVPICVIVLGIMAALLAAARRRSRARREAERYGQQVRARLEAVVERGLSRPAAEVLKKHRTLQAALGL